MTARVWPVDAVAGAPAYSGRALRQASVAPWAPGATPTRPLGARSGVRPGSYSAGVPLVTATSTTWTLKPHVGVIDAESAAEAGPYAYALDANATGSVTAANATYARIDIVWVRIDDPAESDGSSTPAVVPGYTAGTAGPSPSAPATPARAMAIAQINVPVSGGGSPTVTMVAPYLVATGGIYPNPSASQKAALDTSATADSPVIIDDAGILRRSVGTGFFPMRLGGVSAQTTASMGPGFTSETPIVTTASITCDGVTRFKITATPSCLTATQYEFWEFRIKRDSTVIRRHLWVAPSNALTSIPSFTITDVPSAGSHTYSLSLVRTGGTNLATLTASAADPAEIIVEAIA